MARESKPAPRRERPRRERSDIWVSPVTGSTWICPKGHVVPVNSACGSC